MSTPGSSEPVTPSTPQSLIRSANNLTQAGEDITYAPIRFTRGQYDEAEERRRRINFSMNVSQRLNFQDSDNQDYPAPDAFAQGSFNRTRPDISSPEQDHSRNILQRKLKDLKSKADDIISETEWMFDVPAPTIKPLAGDNLLNLYRSKQSRGTL